MPPSEEARSTPPWSAASPTGAGDTERAAALLASRLPEPLRIFAALAYDLAWSWQPGGASVMGAIAPHRWEASARNPVRVLLELPGPQLDALAADSALLERARELHASLEAARRRPFRTVGSVSATRPVAFLCAEFAAHPSLPIYSGGLGVLAGDLLREASDAGFPLVGVGLFYREGYFRQRLDPSGWQHEYWIERVPEVLPLALVNDPSGRPLRVQVRLRGRDVAFQIWRVQLGRTSLYLLDADLPENSGIDRWITARLYDSDREVRLAQYAALGIGGIRALRALGVDPAVVHMNEGHAALAYFELLREGLAAGLGAEVAASAARERLVFTTHTPVAAGNEAYAPDELWPVLDHLPQELGWDRKQLLAAGRVHPENPDEPFGLSVLALRSSRHVNAVSRIHGEVSRSMWQALWPERSPERVPIRHVTNGVHLGTWMAEPMHALLERHLGLGFEERAADPATWDAVEDIPDAELWSVRRALRTQLVEYVRDRSVADRLARGERSAYVEAAARTFDPDVLTVGFARRLAAYKRVHLIAGEPRRALAMLRSDRPIQILIAGKAHPRDEEAKQILQRIFGLKLQQPVGERVAYVEDYDAGTAARLVAGCDVWVNLPRPPLEASGTSGMKAAMNGGLNLSVCDGWWAEAWDGSNGWGIPAESPGDERQRDARDAALLYDLLEGEVVPLFHDRDADGVPRGWVQRVKASLRSVCPRFSTARMLGDYARDVYAPEE